MTRTKDQRAKPKPIHRPTVGMGCSPADWNNFERRWGQYKNDTALPPNQIKGQLLGCLSGELESNVVALKNIAAMSEASILQLVNALAVALVSISTRRTEVMGAK